jgi:hypothetical protein
VATSGMLMFSHRSFKSPGLLLMEVSQSQSGSKPLAVDLVYPARAHIASRFFPGLLAVVGVDQVAGVIERAQLLGSGLCKLEQGE